jgi:hypothetical protein
LNEVHDWIRNVSKLKTLIVCVRDLHTALVP